MIKSPVHIKGGCGWVLSAYLFKST